MLSAGAAERLLAMWADVAVLQYQLHHTWAAIHILWVASTLRKRSIAPGRKAFEALLATLHFQATNTAADSGVSPINGVRRHHSAHQCEAGSSSNSQLTYSVRMTVLLLVALTDLN